MPQINLLLVTEKWDVQIIRAAVGRFCLTSRLSSHMIEWNKSMEKHCHHYYYWGERGIVFLTCPTHLTATVTWAFPVHAHPSLMSLWSHLQNDSQRPASATSLQGPRGHYWDLLGLGPHLDYEWESSKKARYAPSGSNTHPGLCCGLRNVFQEPDAMERFSWDTCSSTFDASCRWKLQK